MGHVEPTLILFYGKKTTAGLDIMWYNVCHFTAEVNEWSSENEYPTWMMKEQLSLRDGEEGLPSVFTAKCLHPQVNNLLPAH